MTSTAPPAAEVRGLVVEADGRRLLHGVDLRVGAGERVALLGASGSGKSLTAAALSSSLSPRLRATGEVVVGGTSVLPARRGRRPAPVAVVPQDSFFALNPLVRVGRQLARPWRRRGYAAAQARAESLRLLGDVGFDAPDAVLDRLPAELSGGQRQRVCIALAVACDAGLLVADEPTTALDPVTQAQVLDAFGAVGSALLMITHDVAVAARLCERTVVLADGRVVDDLATADLLAGAGGAESRRLLAGAAPEPAR